MKPITLGKKKVGNNHPVFLIAEAGVNHNGEISLAKKLIDVAVAANVDAIKFQTYNTERLILKSTSKVSYQKQTELDTETFYEMLKRYELSSDEFIELKTYSEKKGLIFLSTPFDKKSVKFLRDLNLPAFKVGSGDMNNFPLLKIICSIKKPILLSTGMATLKEVKESVKFIEAHGIRKIVIFQCTSNYPTQMKHVNLNVIDTYINEFPDYIIGFSDHSLGTDASIGAVAKGVKVIEKHFTLNKSMVGPDHKASLNPDELSEWVQRIRNIELALGKYRKEPTDQESDIAKTVRKSIVSIKDLEVGELIKPEFLALKRPGYGIPPKFFHQVVGKKTKNNISKDTLIRWEDLE